MEPIRTRPFRLDPVSAGKAMLYAQRRVLLKIDAIIWLIATVIISIMAAFPYLPGWPIVVGVAVGMFCLIFIGRSLRPLRTAAVLRRPQNELVMRERTVEFDAEGLSWRAEGVSSAVAWKNAKSVESARGHMVVRFGPQQLYIPIAAFEPGDIPRVLQLAEAAGVATKEFT